MLVVVSRWFGGILLGPSRFSFINNAARNAIVQSGLYEVEKTFETTEIKKSKGKRK
jgi:putative IMPACT (imprinted ancient) family translation regulator